MFIVKLSYFFYCFDEAHTIFFSCLPTLSLMSLVCHLSNMKKLILKLLECLDELLSKPKVQNFEQIYFHFDDPSPSNPVP